MQNLKILNSLAIIAWGGLLTAAVPAFASLTNEGNGTVYDPQTGLTWTQDANLFYTQANNAADPANFVQQIINANGGVVHDTPNTNDPTGTYTLTSADFDTTTGDVTWWGAQAWVGYLNSITYAGINNWELPVNAGVTESGSPIGVLYYNELNQTTGPFTNTQFTYGDYWLGNEVAASGYANALDFDTYTLPGRPDDDSQGMPKNSNYLLAWTVAPTPAPLPGAGGMLAAGLAGIGVVGRRRLKA